MRINILELPRISSSRFTIENYGRGEFYTIINNNWIPIGWSIDSPIPAHYSTEYCNIMYENRLTGETIWFHYGFI
jgi:hypothetical protein